MWFPLLFLAAPLSPTPPIITRGYGWRTDEVVEMAEGEEEREKNNSPHTMFQINKSSCLKASEGTEGTKAKTRLFIFYSWIPLCLLMRAFFILPSQPGGAQNSHGAGGSSWNQAWTGCFFLLCPREGDDPCECALPPGELWCEIRNMAARPWMTLSTEAGILSQAGFQGGLWSCSPGIMCTEKMFWEKLCSESGSRPWLWES